MKKCCTCKLEKEETEFYKKHKEKKHLMSSCKSCQKNKWKKYSGRYNERNCVYDKNKREEIKKLYGFSKRTIDRHGLKIALFVYDRANRKCENCENEYDLTIHHKDHSGRNNLNKGMQQNNDPDNLILLCRKCHGSIHGKEGGGRKKKTVDKKGVDTL